MAAQTQEAREAKYPRWLGRARGQHRVTLLDSAWTWASVKAAREGLSVGQVIEDALLSMAMADKSEFKKLEGEDE